MEILKHADGIHIGLPDADYHADPAMSASGIKNLCISPLAYWANSHMNPHRKEKDDTDAQQFGKLVHSILLEQDDRNHVVKPEGMSFATKEGKAWRAEQEDHGREIITKDQNAQLQMIYLAAEHSGLIEALHGSIPEVSYFWTDKSGQRCKIRMDALKGNAGYDIKTFANMMNKDLETAIAHTVATNRIHIGAYWYEVGIAHMREQIAARGAAAILQPVTDRATGEIKPPATEEQIAIIETAGEASRVYPYWYVFLEKGGVPNVIIRQFVKKHGPGQEIQSYWRAAKSAVEHATGIYARNMKDFGHAPWIEPAQMKSFDDLEFAAARWILDLDV